jgi:hypothetical protein
MTIDSNSPPYIIDFFFVILDVAKLATTSLRRVVLCGNFQKLCVTYMAICDFGF